MAGTGFPLSRFQEEPVLGILRGVSRDSLSGVLEAAIGGGLRFLEITLNTSGALSLIEHGNRSFEKSLCLGAGTVLSVDAARRAFSAGARFLVAPTWNPDVARYCRDQSIAYFPGALTPTEIERAWAGSATMIKVFPASQVGPKYFQLVKGPFPDIPLMAVGGIQAANLSDYFSSGASAVAFGGSIFTRARMQNRDYDGIRHEVEEFLLAVRKFYTKIREKRPESQGGPIPG